MMVGRAAGGWIAALLLLGAGVSARAETPSQNPNAFRADPTAPVATAPRKSLQWDARGRWTLKLDMDQPVGRDMAWKDVSAGAFFHITPSVRIGGSVGLGDRFAEPQKITPEDTTNSPRVRLETKFKF